MAKKVLISKKDIKKKKTINFNFGEKHKNYIRKCRDSTFNILEGAVRSGKTVDNVFAFAHELKTTKDRIHLASGSTMGNAKLNIGDANGYGLEWIFRGQCRWGLYKGMESLIIQGPSTNFKPKIVIFAGASSSVSFQKIRGNSYGMWIATEVNLHHDNFIKEAFNRLVAAKNRKIFWDLNPDHPRSFIYTDYIDAYAERAKKGTLIGGYNYEHCTIYENVNISKERIDEIVSQYDPNSIWYMRDIEGKRSVADGLIYTKFSAEITSDSPSFLTSIEETISLSKEMIGIYIGVDFGGNKSGHAFCAVGITYGYEKLVILSSEWHDASRTDPDDLSELFFAFFMKIYSRYSYVTGVFCDSAEAVLIRGLKKKMVEFNFGNIKIENAWKIKITDRIFTVTSLFAQNRILYTDDCSSLLSAISMSIWNPKSIELERLDDGTVDIDSLDAFEYTFERFSKKLLKIKSEEM